MQLEKVGAGGAEKATIKELNRSIAQARRKTDRYIRLFHRARVDDIKTRWFDLAVVHDTQAADASRQLKEVLEAKRSIQA